MKIAESKKILICTDHKTLAEVVSEWLKNRNCKTATLVGKASEVTGGVEKKVRKFNPDFLITSYLHPVDAHKMIINEAKKFKQDISAYALCGHPDVLDNPGGYQVFSDLYDIFRKIGVAEAV